MIPDVVCYVGLSFNHTQNIWARQYKKHRQCADEVRYFNSLRLYQSRA